MNLYKVVNRWEDVFAEILLNALNSKDETKEILIYRIFEELFRITPKINFYNKKKLFNYFSETISYGTETDSFYKYKLGAFYKYICKNLCGIKTDFYKLNIRAAIQDLIGYDKFEKMYEY